MDIAHNLEVVRRNIARAARLSGRDPAAVKLVAVSKRVEVARITEAIRLGATALGENRVQELVNKWDQITEPVEWHLIGSLQTNKVKYIIDKVSLIHSLDRWSLAVEISERAAAAGRQVPVLVQLNVAGEATKHGLSLEEAEGFIREAAGLPGLAIQGLMTMAPEATNPEEVRPVFRQLKTLADRLRDMNLPGVKMDWLSMGMTGDYEVAIEEGANLVRIGTGIFGERK